LPLRAAAPALTGPLRTNALTRDVGIVAAEWHNEGVSKSAVEGEKESSRVDTDVTEEELVTRIAADREAGRDTTEDVKAFLLLTGKKNRAALDRLAK
jgi:hypothetical protein